MIRISLWLNSSSGFHESGKILECPAMIECMEYPVAELSGGCSYDLSRPRRALIRSRNSCRQGLYFLAIRAHCTSAGRTSLPRCLMVWQTCRLLLDCENRGVMPNRAPRLSGLANRSISQMVRGTNAADKVRMPLTPVMQSYSGNSLAVASISFSGVLQVLRLPSGHHLRTCRFWRRRRSARSRTIRYLNLDSERPGENPLAAPSLPTSGESSHLAGLRRRAPFRTPDGRAVAMVQACCPMIFA